MAQRTLECSSLAIFKDIGALLKGNFSDARFLCWPTQPMHSHGAGHAGGPVPICKWWVAAGYHNALQTLQKQQGEYRPFVRRADTESVSPLCNTYICNPSTITMLSSWPPSAPFPARRCYPVPSLLPKSPMSCYGPSGESRQNTGQPLWRACPR